MPGVAREKRFPERVWRGATAADVAELRAWMLARHSRRHSDELETWVGAIAQWKPPPMLSQHKLRWFRSVLLRYGPPGRRWEEPETTEGAYRRWVRAVRSARMRRQNERKRSPAPPRTTHSHAASEAGANGVTDHAGHANGTRSRSRSRSRSSGSSSRSNGSASRSSRSTQGAQAPAPAPTSPREAKPAPMPPLHW